MRIKKAIGLLLVLSLCLALGGTAVAVDLGNVSLEVKVADGFAEDADFADANVVCDLYRLATIPEEGETDSVTVAYDYEGLDEMAAAEEDWEDMAQAAASLILENEAEPDYSGVPFGGKLPAEGSEEGLIPGVYLVLAHGADIEEYLIASDDGITTIARSGAKEYTFNPQLVSVPALVDGQFIEAAEIVLKPSEKTLYGDLIINKTVEGFEGEPATFVFHIVDTETGGEVYDNYASIYFTGGTDDSVTVTKLPAGVEMTVTEEYSGARYDLKSDNGVPVTVSAEEVNSVSFTNARNDSGIGGHGINNSFTFNSESGDWDWVPTPAQG